MKVLSTLLFASTATSIVNAMSVPFMDQTSLMFGWSSQSEDMSVSEKYSETDRRDRRRHDKEGGNIYDKLRDDKRFSKFVEILEENRGLKDDLERNDAKLTLFAPTNDAIDKFKKEFSHEKHGQDRERDMASIIRYHVCKEEVRREDLFDGMTLETDLKLKELNNNRQRIRVFKLKGQVILNMYARVEQEIEAENGYVMALDAVLMPPPDIMETLMYLPTKFSTFLLAVQMVDLEKDLEKDKAITAFVPPNSAWETLGFHNLMHLFSEDGRKDLKKVVEYHLAKKLVYSEKLIDQEKTELDTKLSGERLTISAKKRNARRSSDGDEIPSDYLISINQGEASVTFTDAIAENGNVFLINSVLIPENVKLPHQREY